MIHSNTQEWLLPSAWCMLETQHMFIKWENERNTGREKNPAEIKDPYCDLYTACIDLNPNVILPNMYCLGINAFSVWNSLVHVK